MLGYHDLHAGIVALTDSGPEAPTFILHLYPSFGQV